MPRRPRHAVDPSSSEAVEVPVRRAAVDAPLEDAALALGAVGFHLDRSGPRFLWTTPDAEMLLGVPVEAWREGDFLSARVHPADRARVREALASGETRVEWRFAAENGNVVWVEARMWGDAPTRGFLLDVSRQRNAERRLAVQQATTGLLALAETVDAALPTLLRSIAETMGWAAGVYWRPEGDRLVVGSAWLPPGVDGSPIATMTRSLTFAAGEGLPGRVFASGHASWVIDLPHAKLPRSPVAAGSGIRSLVALPIRGRSGVHGVLEFWSRDALDEDAEVLAVLEAVGTQIGLFVERRAAEGALRESDARKGAILEASLDGIVVMDTAHRVVSRNGPFDAMWGEVATLPSMDGGDMMRALASRVEDADQFLRGVHAIEERPDARVRDEVRMKDGRILERHGTGIASPRGERSGVVWSFRDVTSRRRNEETLARLLREVDLQRARLDAIIRSVPGVVWEAWGEPDAAGQRIDFVSDHVETMLGYSTREWLETPNFWLTLVHPEDRERAAGESLQHFLSGKGGTVQFRWRHKEGRYIWAQAWNRVIVDADGKPVGMRGVTLDITDRKRAEEDLRRNADLLGWQRRVLETIARSAPLHETLDILCREAEAQAEGHHFTVLLVDEEGRRLRHGAAPSLPAHYNSAVDGIPIAEGVGSCGTAAFRKEPVLVRDIATDPLWKDFKGLALPIGLRSCWSTPIFGSDGRLLGTWAVYREAVGDPEPEDALIVSVATRLASVAIERARIEDAIRHQRDLTKAITDNTGAALFMMDLAGRPVFLNPAALAMTGYAGLDEVKDRPLHESVHFRKSDGSPYPIEECPIERANAEVRALKGQRDVFCRKDGSLFPVEYNVAPVERAGAPAGVVLEVRDITEELRAEQQLRERADELQRLAEALARSNQELDQFAYVTSHDLKAPLRGIANLSRWIEEDMGPVLTSEARGHLDLLRGRVNRMESLIDAILEFSRAGRVRGKPERVHTGELVRDVVDLLAPPSTFTIEVQNDMPTLVADRTRLQQVFQNLVGNAVKHHGRPDGRIAITWQDMGDRVRFSVADDGPGIDPRFHDRVFVIFQTLQARDKVEGTGVGLALVKKIVESYGGIIRLESEEGKGATFHFTWPKITRGD